MLTPEDIIIETTDVAGETIAESTLLARVRKDAVARELLGSEYLLDIAIFSANFPVVGDLHVECPNHSDQGIADLVWEATQLPEYIDLVDAWITAQEVTNG